MQTNPYESPRHYARAPNFFRTFGGLIGVGLVAIGYALALMTMGYAESVWNDGRLLAISFALTVVGGACIYFGIRCMLLWWRAKHYAVSPPE